MRRKTVDANPPDVPAAPRRVTRHLTDAEEEELGRICEWVRQTCELFGAARSTGYKCAAHFYEGLRWEWEHPLAPKEGG